MFRFSRLAVFLAGFGLAFAALAQDNGTPVDPPGRVARLSYMQGDVSFVPAGENDWVQAQLNRPLITGDKLWTDRGSRATLEVGAAAVRMDQSTSFDFLNLTDDAAQMELTQGTLNLRVRRLYDGQSYEVDTPTLAFVVNRVGEFRIEPNAANVVPSKVVLLIDGRAEIRSDMEDFLAWIDGEVKTIAADYGVTINPPVRVSDNMPTPGAPVLLETLERACETVGAKHRRMASGAGHDTAWIAKVAPSAMIFVPCKEGRSHCAEEWAENDDIAMGAAVLFEAVRDMDKNLKQNRE